MSHFTVLVIGENPKKQLEPFNENMSMPRYVKYTKEQLIEEGRKKIEEYKNGNYAEYLKDKEKYKEGCSNEGHIKYLEEEFPLKLNFSDEQVYEDQIRGYEEEDIGENGELYSTYNPNSKWDWYKIGGRWAGQIKLKNGVEKTKYPEPNFSYGWSDKDKEEVLKKNLVDLAYKKDIDFEVDKNSDEYKHDIRFWEVYIDGDKPLNEKEEKFLNDFYSKKYYIETYKTKENYAFISNSIQTFAVLKNGVWYEKGKMGWFGCSSNTLEEGFQWDKSFYDTFIKDLKDDELLTVVDCHI